MNFYSTNNKNQKVSLEQAVTKGLAPDNGLYMPEHIPVLSSDFFANIHTKSFQEIGFAVAQALLGDDLSTSDLKRIVDHTIQFDAPLAEVEKDIYALELFHGPTMAFKDFGARFMSQLLGHFASKQHREIIILVATSGDTGSAVANGFLGVPGTKVIVLYPSGKVSDVQEKQFTTLGKNITALEVDGTFDDCQRLVKTAFLDDELQSKYYLTSANSINIARLIPQSFYYFYAYSQLSRKNKPVIFSVPSGNFGNLTGGLLAKRMGLPIEKFVAVTNANDIVPEYLATKLFTPRSSTQTISNAMDVGNPSNFVRMLDLYNNDFDALSKDIAGYAVTDDETREAMRNVYANYKYVLDPHGAVGYLGLKKYLSENKSTASGVFLETAHPGKFQDVVENTLQQNIQLPEVLQKFMRGSKLSVNIGNGFDEFKNYLLKTL
ncbi:MAG TPA: threonine synthase [Cyclobacteriaceae bacterium]